MKRAVPKSAPSRVAVHTLPHAGGLGVDAALVGDLVESGAITVAVTGQQNMAGTAAQLSTFLHADRILKASYTLADGAHLQQVWYRPAAPSGA